MDVLTAAWVATGRPQLGSPALSGDCARCGATSVDLTATRLAVSRVFTAFDGWVNPSGDGICPACTWGYRHAPLRNHSHLVTRDPVGLEAVTPMEVGRLLETPLATDAALVVPLRPGRKHLVPTAGWGRVTLDDVQLPWSTADTFRLAAVRRLRAHGFGSRMMAEPSPSWSVLRRISRQQWQVILDDWGTLDPWRSSRLWLDLALYATIPNPAR